MSELVKEVLGPRDGLNEILPQEKDPRNEYIVGVLAPKESQNERDIDADAELMEDGDESDEDQSDDIQDANISGSPSLDPKALPKSLGISFVVKLTDGNPSVDVCFTWARYFSNGESWERYSYYEVKTISVVTGDRWSDRYGSNVDFVVKTLKLKDKLYKVSVFLVNNTELEEGEKPSTSDFLFQPEIRIAANIGCDFYPLEEEETETSDDLLEEKLEEDSLKLLYRERVALARGHLVGVTWSEIDVQREHPQLNEIQVPPFYWVDGDGVPSKFKETFKNPCLRTDYTPCYPMESPSMVWRSEYGDLPEFNPEVLAECWEPDELRHKLAALIEGYKKWLAEQKESTKLNNLRDSLKRAAELHFKNIELAIGRMERSIDLLYSDPDVRLAFCFANKVMALQSTWANGVVYPWRPFQLGFILLNLSAIANETDPDRGTADLLWFATGGGKTESYLGLAAFTIALQRRRARLDRDGHKKGSGVNVLSRYTLRLLTIQQFRRALRVVTAAEYLRVFGLNQGNQIGWRPQNCIFESDYIWGGERFSVGLWVGGGVTPNSLQSISFRDQNGVFQNIPGAIELLKKKGGNAHGEPAQVMNCPCCDSYVAIPNEGLGHGEHTLHLLFRGTNVNIHPNISQLVLHGGIINSVEVIRHHQVYYTASIKFSVRNNNVEASTIDDFWNNQLKVLLGSSLELMAARATRPGYFFQTYLPNRSAPTPKEANFDIFCPNPNCDLNQVFWSEKVPANINNQLVSSNIDTEFQEIFPAFKVTGHPSISTRVAIPAYTVDDQIYHRCPSIIIGTADKFAQLPYEPRAAAIFGNVEYYHSRWGYYREACLPNTGSGQGTSYTPHPAGFQRNQPLHKRVEAFDPPLLIIQDELHLIEGPLGSLYGLYETIIDELCTKQDGERRIPPKYVVATATVRQAKKQVKSLFTREFAQFPPSGIDANDNFFSTTNEIHPLDSLKAGRLYVGICAPGKGAQTPLVRIWSSLLQASHDLKNAGATPEAIDGFLTVVGYFNALRELAGAASLYRQDIPERMNYINGPNTRTLSENPLELSSRKSSTELPGLLELLENSLESGTPEDGVLATSMFGTGVDVDRLRLMVINGQPKSTSSYIQASGRVGRKRGGLVVAFFRASRPRDLDHYEFFTGYHRAIYKYVESVTVAPFSPRAREKALGPLAVALLRQANRIMGERVATNWRFEQKLQNQVVVSGAPHMRNSRHNSDVLKIMELFAKRISNLPDGRRPDPNVVLSELRSELDRWYALSQRHQNLMYNEYSGARPPSHPVVLGDPQHFFRGLDVAFENAPKSLRDVEGTTNFKS
ncbi:DISARM system helicase DrmA [Paenibacillus sp. V4I3]|uniref:DISARM system helicase DrmA n=1 Tax=Paenibacillus sp. V4I3 TaxID=3042305 RepID=UPI0027D853B0|nr:DISARM system helicase DrmA [Paenibacillus sp. V4I3]